MKFAGFIKNSFVDYPGNLSAVVFTFGCNFNCWFCHNRKIIEDKNFENIDEKEVLDFLEKRKGLLDGLVISGGEPTLNYDLENFVKKVKAFGYKIKLDTNGTNPEILSKLLNEKLIDFVAMDVKTSKEKYKALTNCNVNFKKIKNSIELLKNGKVDYEFRTTFAPDVLISDIEEVAKLISGAKSYAIQKYNTPENLNQAFIPIPHSKDDYLKAVQVAKNYVKNTFLRSFD